MAEDAKTCEHCGKVLQDQHSLWQHTKAKHGPKAARAVRPLRPEREPSLGEELAEAIADARSGQPVDGYLLSMFRDQFPRGTRAIPSTDLAGSQPAVETGGVR